MFCLYFRKQKPQNRNSKKTFYISGGNLKNPKKKQKSLLWILKIKVYERVLKEVSKKYDKVPKNIRSYL